VSKLRITALEGEHHGEVLEAQFNPQEIEVDRRIPWQQQSRKGPADLEFEEEEPARMSFELLFDGVESSKSVQPRLDMLHRFSTMDANLHRPPKVNVAWGSAAGAMPTFDGVVEAVSVRYEIFAENGVPVRATAAVKLREAANLKAHTP
jgi:Contractile injection system tube protein